LQSSGSRQCLPGPLVFQHELKGAKFKMTFYTGWTRAAKKFDAKFFLEKKIRGRFH
jgi:hypothetical protein